MGHSPTFGRKKTRRSVLIVDWLADRIITVGGFLVIAAVLGMMIFLVGVVVPLFESGTVSGHAQYKVDQSSKRLPGLSVDEFKTVAVQIAEDGSVRAWHLRTGTNLDINSLDLGGKALTASGQAPDGRNIALGFADGTIRFVATAFETETLPEDAVPKGLRPLDDRDQTDGKNIYSRIPGKQVRKTACRVTAEEEVQISGSRSPIIGLDYRLTGFGERPGRIVAAIDSQGVGVVLKAESTINIMTRKTTISLEKAILPPLPREATVSHVLVTDSGDAVFFAEDNGRVYRFNVRDFTKPVMAETTTFTPPGVGLTALGFLVGNVSIVAGGSDGTLNIHFLIRRPDAKTADGYEIVHTRTLPSQPAAVTGLSPGQRGKTFASSDALNGVWVRHGTSERTLAKLKADGTPVRVLLTPRQDGLLSIDSTGKVDFWDLYMPHPETSWRTLFGKVWYEGYSEPSYTWQSTGATDGFEAKLSLVPLIFGTLKATFYSLLLAVPIALLAAIYTSEFLVPSIRGTIKPVIEVMASIPSVVLGFIAALVLAPVVENWIAAVVLGLFALPSSLICAAYFWQLIPPAWALRLQGMPKLLVTVICVLGALYGAFKMGPMFERAFFDGDFKTWLNGETGRAAPFLFLLVLPVTSIVAAWGFSRLAGPWFSNVSRGLNPFGAAVVDLVRWLGVAGLTLGMAWALALILDKLGVDARGHLIGTYVQRNTLVVGFAMGFAVIPIIYTLAEDALNAVPEHLRSASLGCGATPWQTALWIVLPTAISGVFSAIMIGMGRAVGETMIVVMSAGNTPLIDLNIFNGLRALSANIAVELPEAPKGDTLYRVLFLTGLVLFVMTFVINTVAEIVRLRFRKRSMQL